MGQKVRAVTRSRKQRQERKKSPFYRVFLSRSVVRMAKSTSNSNKDERPANERRRISEDKVATGRTLTLPALMKIGLIYSFVWTFKKIDTGLRNLMVINLIYGIFTDLVMAVLNMSVNVGQTMLFIF